MDITNFKRNPEIIKSKISSADGKSMVAKDDLFILVPQRFAAKGLLKLGTEVEFVCMYCIFDKAGNYAVSNVPGFLATIPDRTYIETIDEVGFYKFQYNKGSVIFGSMIIAKDDTLVFKIFDEYLQRGNIPWYYNYDDALGILERVQKYTGLGVGQRSEVSHFMLSLLSRDPSDRKKYYRHGIKSYSTVATMYPKYVPMKSVNDVANNTLSKLTGSYFNDGVIGALISPSDKADKIEELLRK